MPVFNKMVYNGTEYILGGGNIGEPTNLSASATSNSSIDIKRTDNNLQAIPPSTFQKSVLVRKVGSAPTTPSDGTTVVTETVMNTYQSSAYADTGLTQGTTYYYQVFSYSTDGGITYGTPVSATPSGGWTPGVNTIARWKLDGDTTDEMGNFDLSTRIGSLSYGTLSGGEQYGIFDGNTALTVASVPNWTRGTVSMWYNKTASGETAIFVQNLNQDNSDAYTQMIINDSAIGFWIAGGGSNFWNHSYTLNTWKNIVITQDGNGINVYVDGQSVGSTFADSSWFDYHSSSDQLCVGGLVRGTQSYSKANGYLSNVILESEARTAQEVADYYNQTKSIYGIS